MLLDNIYVNSMKIYEQLDDWIVIAVAQENKTSKKVLEFLKDSIQYEVPKLEEYQTTIENMNLMSIIETTHHSGSELPPYLKNVHSPKDNVESCRFSVEQLQDLYS